MFDHGIIYWDFSSFLLYLVVLLLGMFFAKTNQKFDGFSYDIKWRGLIYMFAPMFLVLVLRESTRGTDLPRYFYLFQELSLQSAFDAFGFSNIISREPLFNVAQVLLSRFTKGMSDEYMLLSFLIMVTVPWMYFACKSLKEECKFIKLNWAFAVLFVLFFIPAFNLLRNVIAVFIVLYAYTQLAKGDNKRFWIYCLIAMCVHYTAVVCAFSYFFVKEGSNTTSVLIRRLAIAIVMFAFVFVGKNIIIEVFGDLDSKYADLATREQSFALGQTLIRFPLLVAVFWYKNELIEVNPHNKLFILLLLFDLLVGQLNYIDQQFTRCALYFNALQIFIYPSFYEIICRRAGKITASAVAVCFIAGWFAYRLSYYLYDNPYYFMPYISNFFHL